MAQILERDAVRDSATASSARALASPKSVWRYTTAKQAKQELHHGFNKGSHFTPGTTAGRLPSPKTAQRQYGLPNAPGVRMTIRLPKNHKVLKNKAIGGEPGRGEVVNMQWVSPKSITKISKLQKAREANSKPQ